MLEVLLPSGVTLTQGFAFEQLSPPQRLLNEGYSRARLTVQTAKSFWP
jgi:hypothetical protein